MFYKYKPKVAYDKQSQIHTNKSADEMNKIKNIKIQQTDINDKRRMIN